MDSIKKNAGSTENQIRVFTHRIKYLTEHLKENRKDFSTKRGLRNLIGKRSKMLKYLKRKNINLYQNLCTNLSLRAK